MTTWKEQRDVERRADQRRQQIHNLKSRAKHLERKIGNLKDRLVGKIPGHTELEEIKEAEGQVASIEAEIAENEAALAG